MCCPACGNKISISKKSDLLLFEDFRCPHCNVELAPKIKTSFFLNLIISIVISVFLYKVGLFGALGGAIGAVAYALVISVILIPVLSLFFPLEKIK